MEQLRLYGWTIVISMVGSAVAIYLLCTSCRSDGTLYLWNVVFSTSAWIALWVINNALNHYLDLKISWITSPVRRLVFGLIGTVLFSVLAIMLVIKAWELAWGVEFSNYYEIVLNSLIITFLISLFFHGRTFLLQWKRSAVEAERYQKESIAATYESLKSQVNPHFLFNSLNALTNLVYEDPDKAVKFIKQLSEVYRYVLDTRSRELVHIDEELKFLESYAYLQQIRFENKLSIDVALNGVDSKVAPLALQMLIENAVKHNEISEDNPLHIRLYQDDGFIIVENNLQKKTLIGEDSSGLGLDNIARRYEFLSAQKVSVMQTDDLFKVKLPIIP